MMPSGGVYSSAADMGRYLQFHINGGRVGDQQLISPELLQTMYTPQFAASLKENYGLGIATFKNQHGRMLAHAGGGFGFASNMIWYPELKLGIATLTNSSGHNLVYSVEQQILDEIIALDRGLYIRRAMQKPVAGVPHDLTTRTLTEADLHSKIKGLAAAPSEAQQAEWRQYTGVYGLHQQGHITQIMDVEMADATLTVDGEQVFGFGSGLFFTSRRRSVQPGSRAAHLPQYPAGEAQPGLLLVSIRHWSLQPAGLHRRRAGAAGERAGGADPPAAKGVSWRSSARRGCTS